MSDQIGLEMTETDDTVHIVVRDDEQPNSNDMVWIVNQEPSMVQLDVLEDNDFEEEMSIDDIEYLDRKISQAEGSYSKMIDTVYKLLNFYAILQAAILSAVFSAQQTNCKNSWGLLALSAIVSGGVILALLREYFDQFRQLRRGRLVVVKRTSLGKKIKLRSISRSYKSKRSVSDAKEYDLVNLGINSNYWRWSAERVVFIVTLIVFSIFLWWSCKTRLLCQ